MRKLGKHNEVHDFFMYPTGNLGLDDWQQLQDPGMGPRKDLWSEVRWALSYAPLRDVRNYTL